MAVVVSGLDLRSHHHKLDGRPSFPMANLASGQPSEHGWINATSWGPRRVNTSFHINAPSFESWRRMCSAQVKTIESSAVTGRVTVKKASEWTHSHSWTPLKEVCVKKGEEAEGSKTENGGEMVVWSSFTFSRCMLSW